MMRNFGKLLEKAVTPVICAALLIATMGLTAFAATSGTLTGSLSNNTAKAVLKNTSGDTRYCHVMIQESDNGSSYTTTATNSGRISSGNTISASKKLTKNHARGVGEIYKSGASESGVALTKYTQIK